MKANDICALAARIVGGARQETHGDKRKNHANIAAFWNTYLHNRGLHTQLGPADVAIMMTLLKVARTQTGSFNMDDYVDAAGYAGVAGEIASASTQVSKLAELDSTLVANTTTPRSDEIPF